MTTNSDVSVGLSLVRNTPAQTLEGNIVLVRSVWSVVGIQASPSPDGVAVVSKLIFNVLQNMNNISDVMKDTPYGLVSSCTWNYPVYTSFTDQEQRCWQHMGAMYEIGIQGLLP